MTYVIPAGVWHVCLPTDYLSDDALVAAVPAKPDEIDPDDERSFVVLKVFVDQRDMRRATLSCGIDPEADGFGLARAQAWSALVRKRRLNGMKWREFDDECPWVAPESDEAEVPAVDPTPPDGAGSLEC